MGKPIIKKVLAMKVLLVGGGSGGHITPLLAVARKLKQDNPKIILDYALERGSRFKALPQKSRDLHQVHFISAGKFRRYHGESLLQKLLDVKTLVQNFVDFFKFIAGCIQAYSLLRTLRPEIVFIKGGFVGVPVGLACAALKIPYLTHDSDSMPGLANRIIARWARMHLTGMPAQLYNYPKQKTHYVGVPVSADYKPVSTKQQQQFRRELDIPANAPVLCITGGSLGAARLNEAIKPVVDKLVQQNKKLYVLHQTGSEDPIYYNNLQRTVEHKFVHNLYVHTGAADVVITRAGATTIAELAAQKKASILVPNPNLAGGHQLKNARYLKEAGAVMVLSEADLHNQKKTVNTIADLLTDKVKQHELANGLHAVAYRDATKQIAEIILQQQNMVSKERS